MSDDEEKRVQQMLDDPDFIAEFRRQLEEESANAPKCANYCGQRCDPPFGDGKKCLVCLSLPTPACMQIIVY